MFAVIWRFTGRLGVLCLLHAPKIHPPGTLVLTAGHNLHRVTYTVCWDSTPFVISSIATAHKHKPSMLHHADNHT